MVGLGGLRLGVALVALGVAGGAMAADQFGGLRGSLPDGWDWDEGAEDPLGFEVGLRYWYSMGAQQHTVGAGTPVESSFSSEDTTHLLEGHLRIDDYSTNTYAKALGGYSMVISGSHTNESAGYMPFGGSIVDGQVGYAGADLGNYFFGNARDGAAVGGLAGYMYWNDSPNTGRSDFTTARTVDDVAWSSSNGSWSVGFDSKPNLIDIHALRLGISGKATFSDQFDVTAEVAAVPYAWINGTLGSHLAGDGYVPMPAPGCGTPAPGPCGSYTFKGSPTSITGSGYGAMGEVMLGFHPTENMTLRLGGRAWYLQGTYDASWTEVTITPPQLNPLVPDDSEPPVMVPDNPAYGQPSVGVQDWITSGNPFSLLRFGALAELTYSF